MEVFHSSSQQIIKLEILQDDQMSSDPGWVFCLSSRSVIFTSLYLFIAIKNNYVIQCKNLMNEKYFKPSQPDHQLFLPFFSNLLEKSCRAVVQRQLSGSDERAPQGPRVCVPVLWDQGTARTATLKTAGHSRSRLCLLCPLRPAVCREVPAQELIVQNQAGLAVPGSLCVPAALHLAAALGCPQLLFSRTITAVLCCCKEVGNCRIIQAEGTPGSLWSSPAQALTSDQANLGFILPGLSTSPARRCHLLSPRALSPALGHAEGQGQPFPVKIIFSLTSSFYIPENFIIVF